MTMISLIFSSLKQGSGLDEQDPSLDFPGKEILWAINTQEMTLDRLEKDGNCSLLCLHSQYEICKLETFGKWKFCTSNFFYNFWGIIKVIQFFRFIHLNFFGPSVFVLAGTLVNASFRAASLLFQNTGKGALRIIINF